MGRSRPVVHIGLELCGWDSYIFLVNFSGNDTGVGGAIGDAVSGSNPGKGWSCSVRVI